MLENGDCEGCDEKPTIFLSQIVNGEVRKVNLCQDCPHRDEIADTAGFALAEMLMKLSAKKGGGERTCEESSVAGKVCCCGKTLADLESTHELGCPNCYVTFRKYLSEAVNCTQKRGCTHRGKVPRQFAAERSVQLTRDSLETELEDAIAAEDYERAARARDLLRQLDQRSTREGR